MVPYIPRVGCPSQLPDLLGTKWHMLGTNTNKKAEMFQVFITRWRCKDVSIGI